MEKGAIWVSTVLYILISLAIIGMVIAAVTPRINSARDKATIEQSIIMLNELDSTIQKASQVQGTKLKQEFKMSRGFLIIDSINEKITWQLNNSAYQYSEEGVLINVGNIEAKTIKAANGWNVALTLNYGNANINLTSEIKMLQPAEIPYKLWIENVGLDNTNKIILNITSS
ncbi:MAG: hypothetical protein QXK80_01610 [Candidatus Pacearchaeota archaeon]